MEVEVCVRHNQSFGVEIFRCDGCPERRADGLGFRVLVLYSLECAIHQRISTLSCCPGWAAFTLEVPSPLGSADLCTVHGHQGSKYLDMRIDLVF